MSAARFPLGKGLVLPFVLILTPVACSDGGGDGQVASPPAAQPVGEPMSPPAAQPVGGLAAPAGAAEATIVAKDIAYQPTEVLVAAGNVKLILTNEGTIPHNLVFEGLPLFRKLETPAQGAVDSETFGLQPGTYTFYCDQAGHRPAGMVGKLVVA